MTLKTALNRRPNRRWPSAVLVGLVATLTLSMTGCSSEPSSNAPGIGGQQPASGPQAPAKAATVTLTPAAGTQDVGPGEPVQLAVANGTVSAVTLTNGEGKQVAGSPTQDKHGWTATEPLGYGKTYSWAGAVTGNDGKLVQVSGSFTTVKPKRQISAFLNVGDGQSYGIAMPIVVTFSTKIGNKAAAEKALTVETTPKAEGSWAWLDDKTVHWRPKEYFKPGTAVKAAAKLYGVKIDEGTYGRGDVVSTFTIGRSQIVKASTQQHRMQVVRDGQQIADYPVSYGLDSDPGRVTHSGTHVVMSKYPTYSMSNPRYGYTDVNVPWAVRISNNGEFIHGLAASVWAQGKKNISHGCMNLSPKNAKEYFDGVLPGDPVEVEGSSQQLSAADGDYSDWTYTWDAWTKLSALNS